MSVTHSFVDFVPSIVIGAPDSESFLSILPGHYFLGKGMGFYAIKLTVLGGLFSGIISIAMLPVFFLFVSRTISFIFPLIPIILSLVLITMVFGESSWEKRGWAFIVVTLSATLGVLALRNFSIQNSIFPLVSGFFSASTLINSINRGHTINRQKLSNNNYSNNIAIKGSLLSSIGGAVVSLIPSIGSALAAFLLSKLFGKIRRAKYLIILGGINTANMIFSFFVLYLIGKTRTGSAVAIKQLIELHEVHLFFIIAAVMIAIGISVFATEAIARQLLTSIQRINYKKLNIVVLFFLSLLVYLFSGFTGLLFFFISTGIGILAITSKVKRTNSMAFLMIPTILFYLGM